MSRYKQGDAVFVSYPYINKRAEKQRPALIISNSLLSGNFYNELLLLPVSTKKQDDGFDLEVDNKSLSVPFPKKSYIRFFKIRPIEEQDLVRKISEVKPEFLRQVIEKLKQVIEIESAPNKGK